MNMTRTANLLRAAARAIESADSTTASRLITLATRDMNRPKVNLRRDLKSWQACSVWSRDGR